MKLAYLVNQYPQPSQSFIRREIAALEAAGETVERFTVRRYDGRLVDPADVAEQQKTTVVLGQGKLALLKDTLAAAASSPGKFFDALRATLRHGKTGDRGRLIQLIYLAEAATLKRMLAARGVTHLHAHFGTNSAEVALLCRLLGGPGYSFTTHGPEEFDRPAQLHLAEKVRRSEFAVCISSYGRSQMWRWADFADWPKVEVVRCGVDEAFLADDAEPPPVGEASRTFVCVGRLAEQKGQLVLMRAVKLLRDRGEGFHVKLLGDGPLRGEIEKFVADNDLEQFVTLAGFASNADVRRKIVASRATVLPSFAEGLPVAIMESLALARPAVTTYVAGIPELVRPGENGWLVPAGDADALAAAMAEVLKCPAERLTEMGRAGADRVRRCHDVRREAATLRRLFDAKATLAPKAAVDAGSKPRYAPA